MTDASDKRPFEAAYDALEALYVRLESSYPGWDLRREKWALGRADTLMVMGWTEKEFYAELDRRRAARYAVKSGTPFSPSPPTTKGVTPDEPDKQLDLF